MDHNNVYDYILSEEQSFRTSRVPICDGWEWSFAEHIKRSTLMKNSQYEGGSLGDRPYKNITRPILNVQYRAEGIDVKQVEPFVNDPDNYYKSFLTRRFHSPYARKYHLDTYFDDLVESYVDYGIAISKNINNVAPEVLPLQRIAFCDQTDVEGGPLCEKHAYSIDQLLEMKGKWISEAIDQAIILSRSEKTNDQSNGQKQKTPGRYIEIYELHGMLPKSWRVEGYDGTDYEKSMYVICFYLDKTDGKKKGIVLFKGKENPKKKIYMVAVRDKIFGRCAGFGGIEELFEPQLWINYDAIQIKEMLDAATIMAWKTDDPAFEHKNKLKEMEKNQVVYIKEGHDINQMVAQPYNIDVFNRSTQEWVDLARTTGSADESILGKNPASGTPFKLQELVNIEAHGLHAWRQGKIATHLGEVYREWILPGMVKEMNTGTQFIDNLTLDELQEIANIVAENKAERKVREYVIEKNMIVSPEARVQMVEMEKQKFMRGGGKRFIKTLQDELAKLPVDVEMNIAGKQKDLAGMADKLVNIFREVIANPQILANPAAAKIFNMILESSGMSSMDFAELTRGAAQASQQPKSSVPSNVTVEKGAPTV